MGQNPKEGQGIMENSQNFTPNNDITNSQTTVGAGGGVVSGVRDKNNDLNELIDEFKSLESDKVDTPSNETKSEDDNTKEISETLSDMSFDEPETTSVIKEGEKYTLSQEENDQIEKYLLGADEDDDDVVEYVEDEEEPQSDHSADGQEEVEEEVEEEVVDEDEDEPVIIEDDFDEDEDNYDDYNTKDKDNYDDYDDEETADDDYNDTYDDSDEDLENDEYADEDLEEDDNYADEYEETADEEDDVVADDESDVAVDEENDADETADEGVAEAEDAEKLESEDETLQQEDTEENKEVEESDKESEQLAKVGEHQQEQVADLGQGVVQKQEPVQNVQSQSVESVEQHPIQTETQAEVVAEYKQPQQMPQPVQQSGQQAEQKPQVVQQVPVQPVQYAETPQVAQQPQPVQQPVQQAEQQPQVIQQVPVQPVQYAETPQVAQQPQPVQQPVQQAEQQPQVAQQTYITPQAVEPTPQTVAQPVLQPQPADSYVEMQTTNANGNNLATNEEPVRYFASVSKNTESTRNDVQRVIIPLGVDTAEKEENRSNGAYIQVDAQKGFPAEQQSEPEYEDSEYTYINTENKPSKDDEVEFEDAEYVFKNNDKNEGQGTQEPEYENTEYVFKNISVNMSPVQDEPEYEDSEYTYTNTQESDDDNQLNNELPQAGEVKTESEPVLTNEQELAGNSVDKESGLNERSAEMKALEDRLFARIMSTLTEMKITPGEAREAISNATNTIVLPEEEVKLDLSKFNGKVETFVPLESIPQATWEDVVKRKGHHTYHVTCASNGGYFIKKAKTASPYAFVELKDEALEVAKAYAKREKAELKIHDAKGVIEQSMSFGKEKKKSNKK